MVNNMDTYWMLLYSNVTSNNETERVNLKQNCNRSISKHKQAHIHKDPRHTRVGSIFFECQPQFYITGWKVVGEVKKVGKSRNFQPKVGKSRNFSVFKVGK